MPTMVDVDQYKSALTPQQVDTALKKIADNDIADFLTRQDLLNVVYPVGSIYTSVNNVSPQTFLGGTWQQIQERFLLASGGDYTAGSTGGEAVHTLTQSRAAQLHTPHSTAGRRTLEHRRAECKLPQWQLLRHCVPPLKLRGRRLRHIHRHCAGRLYH